MGLGPVRFAFLLAACAWLGCASAPPPPTVPKAPLAPESPRQREPEPGTALDAESAARARVVETARSMVGVPYRYGGGTPSGFDCSGLVRYSFERGGFPGLPHNSRGQYASTQRIPLAELRPGDLLFFTFRGRNVSHVGSTSETASSCTPPRPRAASSACASTIRTGASRSSSPGGCAGPPTSGTREPSRRGQSSAGAAGAELAGLPASAFPSVSLRSTRPDSSTTLTVHGPICPGRKRLEE